jgi:hypothetical protein
MTAGTLAWGCTAAALCVVFGMVIGYPIGHRRGWDHATEEAEWQRTDARWKGLAEEAARPTPVRPAPPAETPRTGPGKHRHPAGPRHAELPAAGYLPAETSPWGGTITVPAPVQAPPWETRPPEPEPRTEVLEPTAADCLRPDGLTDTGWTRRMAREMAQEMDRDIERMEQDMGAWIAERITATDPVLKEITGGAR